MLISRVIELYWDVGEREPDIELFITDAPSDFIKKTIDTIRESEDYGTDDFFDAIKTEYNIERCEPEKFYF